jgi:endonuclease/exonuclease/phosphatase family metal-dependent hydrolase
MKIASWNIEGRLTPTNETGRGTPNKILDAIEALDADIVVLPEAYSHETNLGVDERLRKMGYQWEDARYDEKDRIGENKYNDDLYIRILSRREIIETFQLKWNNARSLLAIVVSDPKSGKKVRIIATHLDDRSEKRRLRQVDDAISFINSTDMPTVMMGDFNAMHLDMWSRIIGNKFIKMVGLLFPHKRARTLVSRLSEMASGTTLARLELETALRDVDVKHHPTTTPKLRGMEFMPSIRMAQIDHIFVTPDIIATDFQVAKDSGSDHRAISTEIEMI